MMSGLKTELAHGVFQVTISRPDRMNSVDLTTMLELGDVLAAAVPDPEVRVVVLAGEGKAFCVGADLGATVSEPVAPEEVMNAANRVVRTVVSAPVPVLAEINGPAAGFGASLALACDLSFAAVSSYLLLSFVNVGLMPDGGAAALISAAAGRTTAARMALLGQRLPAAEAVTAGLITEIVDDDLLAARVQEVAAKLAAGPRRALELTKRSINKAALGALEQALENEKTGQSELLASADFAEGVSARIQRREPNFP